MSTDDDDVAWLDEPLDAETLAICETAHLATIPWDDPLETLRNDLRYWTEQACDLRATLRDVLALVDRRGYMTPEQQEVLRRAREVAR